MLTILTRIFIKNPDQYEDPSVREAYGILCGAIGILLNTLLFAGKLSAGIISGSIAITADSLNNFSDAGSSIVTLLGFKLASQQPDSDHPFGHGRFEYISGLIVAFIILLMGFELLKSSVVKILHPEKPEISPLILVILLLSIAVKCYMAFYNKKIGTRIHSISMAATAMDSLSDVVATTLVLISTLLAACTDIIVDGYCGVAVAIFILITGFHAAKDTISPLLGQAPDPEFVKQVNDIVLSYDGIIGVHDLMVHNYGPGRLHISLHAEVPADGDILQMHDLIDLIEHNLRTALKCSAVIHMDPVCVNDPETNQLRDMVEKILEETDPCLSMHDFRIVKGPTHTNLIFDVVAPYSYKLSDNALTELLTYKIKTVAPECFAVIDVDKK